MSDDLYADVILPLSLTGTFTYRVPGHLSDEIQRGKGVIVPFGKRRLAGIVFKMHNDKPDVAVIKPVIELAGPGMEVAGVQLKLWQWVSEYYHCSLGEVINAAIPSAIASSDENRKFRKKTEVKLELARPYTEKELSELLDGLQKARARYRLMMTFLEMISYDKEGFSAGVSRSELVKRAGVSSSVVKKLIEQGILKEIVEEKSRFSTGRVLIEKLKKLSDAQRKAYEAICSAFDLKTTVLLHGVTSSGKTEIYIHLINEALDRGEKVLYMLPEIALTTQIINRLRAYFGDLVGIYHSGLSDNEKAEVYERISGSSSLGEYKILLGVRSSVFIPVNKLGLIIIDEEHDSSFKQFDPAPRYNARDTAIMRAHLCGAKVLLGSATPSVESMYNAKNGKYGYAHMEQRFGNIRMPELIMADSKEAYRRKAMISHFTPGMIAAIDEALAKGEQIVLLRNRRGFAHFIICSDCGWTPVCPNCSVNYTYHKNMERLYCHYCGSYDTMPKRCDACSSTNIKLKGFGTEKVEDEISILFPDARIERMDYDSTRRRGSVETLIKNLEEGRTDILIGTQMISKGLDIENLTVVGILNIDGMLFYPDFRAHERCFQLAAQVSGRAGRRKTRGKVIIQTANPHHPVMKQILHNDYEGMYESQLAERKEFNYPPFCRLIRVYIKHKDKNILNSAAQIMASNLKKVLGDSVLGPEFPPHSRLQNLYIKSILLKTDKRKSYRFIRELILRNSSLLQKREGFSTVRIYSDADPQ